MSEKKAIKARAVIIDVKDFPKSCPDCAFYAKSRCIPQGESSTTAIHARPDLCPLVTSYAYLLTGAYLEQGKVKGGEV
jgi:hypothetical protein